MLFLKPGAVTLANQRHIWQHDGWLYRSCNNGSVITQSARATIFFLICASGIYEVGWKAASRPGRRLIWVLAATFLL